ncbi:PorV/PorQ family protein [Melioribacter sp. OK-6-Me]|uniref:PorV/PorQ family protein n=1 Tax=unclassified Melioribacter TaxID=2627329 RepID=UPI003EDA34D3
MKKINLITLVLLTLFIAGSLFAGGGSRNGTAGATQLLVPVGARGISMAGATLVDATGVESLYWNPANLARGEYNTYALFSHMNYFADINVEYGAVSTNIEGIGALAFSIKSIAVGDIPVTTVQNPDGTGQTFSPSFITVGMTYARMLSDRISVGLTANIVSEKIDLVSATGIAFNLGISYKNLGNIDGLSFAVVLKNLGPQMDYDGSGLNVKAISTDLSRPTQYYKIDAASFELPSTLELALGYNYQFNETNSLIVNGVFQNSNFYGDEYRFGAEYAYNDLFFVRGGYTFMPELDSDSNTFGLTAGFGINYNLGGLGFKIDYAFREMKFFNDNHVFTVTLGL